MRELGLYFQSITARDSAAALAALGRLDDTTARRRFEGEVAEAHGAAASIAVGSGRSAIFLWLQGVGIAPGDEIVVTGFTCLAVVIAVLAADATPVYADIDPWTLNATPASVDARITPRTRGVIVQHTLGNPAQVDVIVAHARARGLATLEDCALAPGSRRGGRAVGTFADAAIYSFELSKVLSSGWGGMLVVNDPSLAARALAAAREISEPRRLTTVRRTLQVAVSSLCYHPSLYRGGKYAVAALFAAGIFRPSTEPAEYEGVLSANFLRRLGAPQSILAARQWRRMEDTALRLWGCRDHLARVISEAGAVALPICDPADTLVSNRVSLLVRDPAHAVEWFRRLGVELGRWFDAPVSPLPEVPARIGYVPGVCPIAEGISRHIINLPAHPRMSGGDATRVGNLLLDYVGEQPDRVVDPACCP